MEVIDGREKRVTPTAAGEGRRQGTAAGDESVDNRQREWWATKRAMESRVMVMERKKARVMAMAATRAMARKRGRVWAARAMATAMKWTLVQWQRRW